MSYLVTASGITYLNKFSIMVDDFLNGASGSSVPAGTSGTGAATVALAPTAGHIGVVECTTGTDTTGRAGCMASQVALFGSGAVKCNWLVSLPVLSDGTDTFTFRAGMIDVLSGESVDGVYFEYDTAQGTDWRTVTANSSTRTKSASSVTVTAAAWYNLRAEVNAAGTSVAFYVNDVLVATHTANIPTGAGRVSGIGAGIVKSAGTTARTCLMDYVAFQHELTTAR